MQDAAPFTVAVYKIGTWASSLFSRAARNITFQRVYAVMSLVFLLGSTLFWAILGARLQVHNSDQLSDPYIFSNWATFHGAYFPGSHTFLLKWPIFWLLSVWGINASSLVFAGVSVVLVTVAVLAAIIYRIDRRPVVFGTVCLGLSLALLLVPAQPYAGGILPVNMAMLTTRNLEYALYLLALIFFIRARYMKSLNFILGVLTLTLLIASDKLFMSLSVGGALLAVLVYLAVRNREATLFSLLWFVGSLFASVMATGLLFGISALHLTHLGNASTATPYAILPSSKNLIVGIVYAVVGVFTNAGANPAYNATIINTLPGTLAHRFWSVYSLPYVIACGVLLCSLVAIWRVMRPTLQFKAGGNRMSHASLLAIALVWSTFAAIGVFVLSNHYYAVDARYLAIGFFALAVSVTVWLRGNNNLRPEKMLLIAGVFLLGVVGASVISLHITRQETGAFTDITSRNELIDATLKHHRVDVLVGDYWRVLPIKLASRGHINVFPLANCTQPSNTLTSVTWQPNLSKHSFAYLVTLDGSLTNFPNCSLSQITAKYGHPNSTQIISGTPANPTEALLFYDTGSHPDPSAAAVQTTPLLPVQSNELTKTECTQATIMNVVAHEDDDLLFLNPDMLHELHDGECVRTVFMTAGDAGFGKLYWLSRRLGSEAAYSHMLGIDDVWDEQTLQLGHNEYVTIATPHASSQVSLIFMNLPDGDLRGQGFEASDHESLAKLYDGKIKSMRTVDGQSSYTYDQVEQALVTFMAIYRPAAIHTQAAVVSAEYPDHSDHITTGNFTELAAAHYSQQYFGGAITVPVTRYIGYPIHGYIDNVSGDDLQEKESTFLAYARYDGGVCQSMDQCAKTPTYGSYIARQYVEDTSEQ